MERYQKLLEVYDLETILELIGMEQVELLELLDELGYLHIETPEPL